jgi:hypothetical protein
LIADPAGSGATPFFTAPVAERGTTRMLLISYCFPPDPSVGSLRWEKLTRLAAERGWVFDVVTCAPTGSPLEDRSRLDSLPPGIRVYGVTSREHPAKYVEHVALVIVRSLRAVLSSVGRRAAARHATAVAGAEPRTTDDTRRPHSIAREHLPRRPRTVRDLLRAYFVWVDHAVYSRWARRALRLSLRLARHEDYAAVISSGPPHMAHEAGRAIAARLEIPFVMDMRDPWSLAEHVPESFASPLWLRLSSRFESRAVAQASVVAANTDVLADALRAAYPGAASRVITVRNGSDDDDPLPHAVRGRRFVIAYPGIFYGVDTIRVVFEATARAATACQATADDIGVEIIGPFSDDDIARLRAIAEAVGAGQFVNIGPARSRADALSFMAAGSMLVALPGHNVMTVIPSKLYEYARLDAWVLALAEPSSALERVLRGTTADVVGVADVDAAARAIERRFREHRAGTKATPIGADGRFSRRAQAAILFDAIAACMDGAIASATRDAAPHHQRGDHLRRAVTADAFR